MKKYELLYILSPSLDEEGRKEVNERIQSMIKDQSQDLAVDEWGMKALAYEIEDQREGYYVLVTFSAEAQVPAEIERVLRINDKVMRFLITLVKEPKLSKKSKKTVLKSEAEEVQVSENSDQELEVKEEAQQSDQESESSNESIEA